MGVGEGVNPLTCTLNVNTPDAPAASVPIAARRSSPRWRRPTAWSGWTTPRPRERDERGVGGNGQAGQADRLRVARPEVGHRHRVGQVGPREDGGRVGDGDRQIGPGDHAGAGGD